MKRIFALLAICTLAVLSIGAAQVERRAISTYTSCFSLQNLEETQATLSIVYYNQNGTTAANVADTLGANQYKSYCPLDAVGAGFNGSIVISSNAKLASITNVTGDGYFNGASYTGQTGGATTVYVPLLMKENYGYSTWFNVQNAGSADANVTISYSDGVTGSCTGLKPGAACTLNQRTESHASGWVGSATVTSNQPVVVTVLEVQHGGLAVVMFAYNGFTEGATNPVMPLINANNYGYWTGVQIMNSGTVTTEVTVSYTPATGAPGTACTEKQTIGPGNSKTFAAVFTYAPGAGVTTNCATGPTFVGSGRVTGNTANQPLTVIVNQLNSGSNKGAAYAGFDPAKATSAVAYPLVMDRNYGYWTGFSVMNVSTDTVTINCSFTGSTYTVSGSVPPGGTLVDNQINKVANGYTGSAVCTATGVNPKVIGTLNQVNTLPQYASNDAFMVYEGISK